MRVQTPQQRARQYRQQDEWRKRNVDVLNLKRRNRYATDPEYRERRQRYVRECRARKNQFKEAA